MVTLVLADACGVCGYRRKAFLFPDMRVNKRSMRSVRTGVHLGTGLDPCRECGRSTGEPVAPAWRLAAHSHREVTAYRLRRWPELAAELDSPGTELPLDVAAGGR